MYSPRIFEPVEILTNVTLTVSGGETPSLTSDPLSLERMSKANVYVKNTGASTHCTVLIIAKPTVDSTMEYVIKEFVLGAPGSGTSTDGMYIPKCGIPGCIYATATNSDAANAAEVSVSVERWR
jgi:hypothetical protein